jgi:hypothetical protein
MIIKATQLQPISFIGISTSKFIKAKGSENFINFFKSTTNDNLVHSSNINANEIIENSNSEKYNVHSPKTEINNKLEISNDYSSHKISNNQNIKPSTEMKQKQTSSPCSSIQHSLKSDNFKKSFFMNILKHEESKLENLNLTMIDENISQIHEYNTVSNDNSDTKNNKNINSINTENTIKNIDNVKKQQESLCVNNEKSVEIEEIFPDLNNIDINIVRLLPLHLQEEVKKLLKTTEVHEKNFTTNKITNKEINKNIKSKYSKTKTTTKSKIQTFLINTDMKNDFDNLKKCPQCDQLIVINKFDEHNDYHVAQNLQKEINQTSDNQETKKRKKIMNSTSRLKKRINDEIVSNSSNSKRISSFFQQ